MKPDKKTVSQKLNEISEAVNLSLNAKEDVTFNVCDHQAHVTINHGKLKDCNDNIVGNELGLCNDINQQRIRNHDIKTYGELKDVLETAMTVDTIKLKEDIARWQQLVNLMQRGIVSKDTPLSPDTLSIQPAVPEDPEGDIYAAMFILG